VKPIAITRTRIAIALGALVAAGGGLGLYSAISAGDDRESTPVEQLAAEPVGQGRFARAYGMSVTEGAEVFTLGNGARISVAETATAKCLFIAKDGDVGETCDSNVAINEGKAIDVADECGSSGENRMEITGLAPNSAARVRLNLSDGPGGTTPVTDGAFKFDGANPASTAPYPTGVTWIASDGAPAGEAALPVEGDKFCLPPE